MIRFFHTYFPARTLFLGISEAVLVTTAFVIATFARLGANDANLMLHYEQGFLKISVVAVIFILCMYYFDLYDSLVLSNRREVLTRLVQVLGTVCIMLALLYFAIPTLQLGRGIFVMGFALVALLLFAWRRLFLVVNTMPQFAQRTLILGDSPLAKALIGEIESRKELGIRVAAHLREIETNEQSYTSLPEAERFEALSKQVESYRASRIIVAMGERRGKLPVEALLQLKASGVQVQDGAEVYEAITGKVPLESLRLSWLLFSPSFYVSQPLLVYKRIFSFMISLFCLIVAAPIMAIAAIAIRLDSAGPIIFKQKRVGERGKLFTLYKFRTMVDGADQDHNFRPAEKTDGRFTRVGVWLRRARIDELPQLVNILRGDMYFVGPRPFVQNQEEECLAKIPYYRQRWSVKPGATGWAQVNRGYCATIEDNTEKLAYDLFYIKNISIGLDLLILFKTLKTLLLSRGSR
ncbi:MAG TPA: exopolysaccharide biosynthesis polyprenyl glycosylphosphotransferase [Candidatus Acidoferrales bacterium]|nr:exopolysaccharide biosynthesis polyprenyl glycosylphosphotransferase [Candidatus Acidoferrales bacterium]